MKLYPNKLLVECPQCARRYRRVRRPDVPLFGLCAACLTLGIGVALVLRPIRRYVAR